MEIKGIYTALVTPFKNYDVDEEALKGLIDFQLKGKINGLVPCGTTGEAATLSYEEHEKVVELTVKHVKGAVPVVAGTGSNSTKETIELSESAKNVGADMCLLTTPYYNKPTQEGLYRHYGELATRVGGPIIIYNVPGRTGVNMLPETVLRCAEFDNIVGIKEASGNQYQVDYLISNVRARGLALKIWSGNDDQAFHLCCSGGDGVISVLSNVAPADTVAMIKAVLAGDLEKARELHLRLLPLMNALFVETNPIPVKYAVHLLGYCENELRLPLVELSEKGIKAVEEAMKASGVL